MARQDEEEEPMDAMTALTTRVSPLSLEAPAPSGDALDQIIAAALRAPDHGKLRPWRMFVIEGEGRDRLGALMVDALKRREPDAPEPLIEREAAKPLRAPMIIAVAAKVDAKHPKIPAIEQILSAGCAAQNIQLAAHALGFGCNWKTGDVTNDPEVKAAFGLGDDDRLIAFLYLGTPAAAPPVKAIAPDAYVSRWPS
jgi:nitroreductase